MVATGNLAVLGAQWGDEGKGKIVDLLAPAFAIVARSQGGHNAGHTVFVEGDQFILHLIPSGILHPGVTCVIGNGVVVDPTALFAEIDELHGRGIDTDGRLLVSNRAHVILPYHRHLEAASEDRLGAHRIGTTSRGIGPSYEQKAARSGVRIGDLADSSSGGRLTALVRSNVEVRNRAVPGTPLDWRTVRDAAAGAWPRLASRVVDTSRYLHDAIAAGRPVLFEGAQGAMLDVDHGTYPYVTSSNATIGGVCTGLGVGPRAIGHVLGIAKAYTTRVGEGPLPTELNGDAADRLRELGREYGASTGRPRRCGWFDAVAVRYAVRVNGIESLAVTKLDVLDQVDSLQVCTGYRCDGRLLDDPPGDVALLGACVPVYETLAGWSGEGTTAGVRNEADLPTAACAYLERLETLIGVPISIISTGSDRRDTIVRTDTPVARHLGA
ncbi:MAG: adenylosuccinate synthase [Acidobacteria bacterium]|nr:adenylosuccinate synthase [Acidobacteriota bacterium]